MLGWKIFMHAWRQVTGNLWAALRMSWAIGGVAFALLISVFVAIEGDAASLGILVFLLCVVCVVGTLWVIVSWHRFILLEEQQTSLMPKMHAGRMFSYFLNVLGIGLVTMFLILLVVLVGGMVVGLIVGMAATIYEPLGVVMVFVASLGAVVGFVMGSVLFYRFGAALVGAALGKELSLSDAFKATKGHTWALFVMSLPVMCVGGIASFLLEGTLGIPGLVIGAAVQWFSFILGASCLTTIYGYFIEKRDLV